MADYIQCPTCRGKGLLPADDAARIDVHRQADDAETTRIARERAQQVNDDVVQRRRAAADARHAELHRLLFGDHAACDTATAAAT